MCNPALILVGTTILGGAMQAKAQGEEADAQAVAARTNAAIAESQAEQAKAVGALEEQQIFRKMRQTIGAQRAAFGSANVDPSSGSALDLQTEAAQLGTEDAYIARSNAMRQAWGFGVEAQQSREAARYALRSGRQAQRRTLLTTASRAYGGYYGQGG